MNLDNGNIIALLALEVGVLSAFFALLVHYINNYVVGRVKVVEDIAASMRNEEFFLSRISENAIRLFTLHDNLIMGHHILLDRLLLSTGVDRRVREAYQGRFRSARREVNKTTQTLIMYSSQKEWRQSAFKQLSEDFGAADTLCAFLELRRHEEDLADDLERAIADLRTRLDERSRN